MRASWAARKALLPTARASRLLASAHAKTTIETTKPMSASSPTVLSNGFWPPVSVSSPSASAGKASAASWFQIPVSAAASAAADVR